MTHYNTLGINQTASPDDIKKAYRKKAMEWHPDRNDDKVLSEIKIKEINQAYDILRDEYKKRDYDDSLKPKKPKYTSQRDDWFDGNFKNIYDIDIEEMIRRHSEMHKNDDIHIDAHVSLEDAFKGKTSDFYYDDDYSEQHIQVKIPAGISTGKKIKCNGYGQKRNKKMPPGDLYLDIIVDEHDKFRLDGNSIFYKTYVNPFELMLGSSVIIPTVDGAHLEVQIRAGTQPASKIRIPNRGMCIMNSSERGDMFIEFVVLIPEVLTEEQIILLTAAKNSLFA